MTHEDDHDRIAERVREAYRGAPLDADAARGRLLERLRREPPPGPAQDSGGRTPGFAAWRPMFAAAAVLVVFAAGALAGWTLARGGREPAPAVRDAALAAGESDVPVVFALPTPGAKHVALVGDFNGWDANATPLHRAALGDVWVVEVRLSRGLHTYAFVVDGERWIPDPGAPLAPGNGFGARNSVVIVGESAS